MQGVSSGEAASWALCAVQSTVDTFLQGSLCQPVRAQWQWTGEWGNFIKLIIATMDVQQGEWECHRVLIASLPSFPITKLPACEGTHCPFSLWCLLTICWQPSLITQCGYSWSALIDVAADHPPLSFSEHINQTISHRWNGFLTVFFLLIRWGRICANLWAGR